MSDVSVATRRAKARRWVVDRRTRLVAGLVLVLVLSFTLLALSLRGAAGTRVDLAITLAIQSLSDPLLTSFMVAISLPGFWPWSWLIPGILVVGFLLVGLRREALFLALTPGAGVLSGFAKLVVERPRPGADAVHVFARLLDFSYPSGHVVTYVSLYGFAFFLFYVLFRPAWGRTLVLLLFGLLLSLVGVSRIYMGQHWASDVVGGYALGTAYLLLLIEAYHLTRRPAAAPTSTADLSTEAA
jgi:undecaprenyl-diphosphatase